RCETSVPSASVSCPSMSGSDLALELAAQLHRRAPRPPYPAAELPRDARELARPEDQEPDEEKHCHPLDRHGRALPASTPSAPLRLLRLLRLPDFLGLRRRGGVLPLFRDERRFRFGSTCRRPRLVLHCLAEAFDRAAQIRADVLEPVRAEHAKRNCEHDQQLPDTDSRRSHRISTPGKTPLE